MFFNISHTVIYLQMFTNIYLFYHNTLWNQKHTSYDRSHILNANRCILMDYNERVNKVSVYLSNKQQACYL